MGRGGKGEPWPAILGLIGLSVHFAFIRNGVASRAVEICHNRDVVGSRGRPWVVAPFHHPIEGRPEAELPMKPGDQVDRSVVRHTWNSAAVSTARAIVSSGLRAALPGGL